MSTGVVSATGGSSGDRPDPYREDHRAVSPPSTLGGRAGNRLSQAKAAKRAADLAWQASQRLQVDGYVVQPAIGKTGGADNVGWELHPSPGSGPTWYLRTREEAIEAIERHRRVQGSRQQITLLGGGGR